MANLIHPLPAIPNLNVRAIPIYTGATGQTVAVTISKNGAAFANPSAGATNATEIADGWYMWTPSTTDTGTDGPFIVKGNGGGDVFYGFTMVFNSMPRTQVGTASGHPILGSNAGNVSFSGDVTFTNLIVDTLLSIVRITASASNNNVNLGSTERDAIATALLDLASGVETSTTVRQALRAIASALCGNVTAAGATYAALNNSGTTRLSVSNPTTTTRTVTPSL